MGYLERSALATVVSGILYRQTFLSSRALATSAVLPLSRSYSANSLPSDHGGLTGGDGQVET